MQYSAIIMTIMASVALATPTKPVEARGSGSGSGSSYEPCGSSVLLYSEAACCSGDIANLVDLTCATVSETPTSADNFADICATSGQTAECCTIGVLGLDLVCKTPVGL